MADGIVDISFVGVEELIKDFNRLKYSIQGKIVRNAMDSAVQPIASRARELVPVDTGALKESIQTRVIKSRGRILGQVYASNSPFDASGMFKGDQYYAGMIEYGHRIGKRSKGISRNSDRLSALRKVQRSVHSTQYMAEQAAREEAKILRIHETRQGFVQARPFLRPALAQMKGIALAILSESVASQVKDYVARKGTGHLRQTVTMRISKAGKMLKKWSKSSKKRLRGIGITLGGSSIRVKRGSRVGRARGPRPAHLVRKDIKYGESVYGKYKPL